MQKIEILKELINDWIAGDVDGVLARVTDDVEYHYLVGIRPIIGKHVMAKFLPNLAGMQKDLKWRITHYAENGNILLVEGVDDYISDDGVHIQNPYMGAFEFRDGKICAWRDYVNERLYTQLKTGEEMPDWFQSLVADKFAS